MAPRPVVVEGSPQVARQPDLGRRLVAEALGTGLLVAVVVGSGVAAQRLSPDDVGLQLLENALVTALGLTVLIAWLGPVSGAHFNPVVSMASWWWGRGDGNGLSRRDLLAYVAVQCAGAVLGSVLAHAMFAEPLLQLSRTLRDGPNLVLSEVVATFGLVVLIGALVRSGRQVLAAPLVGAYIGGAYFWTASTSFANPAVTLGRTFSDTFAGIAWTSMPAYVLAQLLGGAVAVAAVAYLHPGAARGRRD